MEEGSVSYPDAGSPQGGVISPLLANIYLHYVLDQWFEETVKSQLLGSAKLIRFADDFVIVFSNREDALPIANTHLRYLTRAIPPFYCDFLSCHLS